jgi:hypothetical protein
MADKIRREKDVIQRTVNRYLQTTTEAYTKYFEGGPTYIIYYQLSPEASTQDASLENVYSLVGNNTPNKYKRIEDVVVYGVDAMDISNEITERGLESMISGEFIMLPDSIKPYPGDFIVFDYDGLRDHIFRIDNVQFDKASPKKFFRVNFAIWKDNAELILGTLKEDGTYSNISGDFVLNYQNIGGQDAAVVSKADADAANQVKLLYDGYVEKFANLFYHEDMDIFTYRTYAPGTVTALNTESTAILAGQSVYSVGIENGYTRVKYIKNGAEEVLGTALSDIAPGDFGIVNTVSPIPTNVWSPYLQKFIYNNKLLEKYKKEIMVEFYVNNIDQRSNPEIFSDYAYSESIYRKLETQNNNLTFENSFVGVSNYDLRQTRNLPFFHSTESYRVLRLYSDGKPSFYLDAINFLHQDYDETLLSLNSKYKILPTDVFADKSALVEEGKVFYRMLNDIMPDSENSDGAVYLKKDGDDYSISLDNYSLEQDTMLKVITSYLNGSLTFSSKSILYEYVALKWTEKTYYTSRPLNPVTGDLVLKNGTFEKFNGTSWDVKSYSTSIPTAPIAGDYYYKKSIISLLNDVNITGSLKDYMLVPMLLFVLKQTVKDAGV